MLAKAEQHWVRAGQESRHHLPASRAASDNTAAAPPTRETNSRRFTSGGWKFRPAYGQPTAGRGPYKVKKKQVQGSQSSRGSRHAPPLREKVGCDRSRARKAEGPMIDCRVAAEHRFRRPTP